MQLKLKLELELKLSLWADKSPVHYLRSALLFQLCMATFYGSGTYDVYVIFGMGHSVCDMGTPRLCLFFNFSGQANRNRT